MKTKIKQAIELAIFVVNVANATSEVVPRAVSRALCAAFDALNEMKDEEL